MYTTHIKSLIINSEALKCGKIKSKTITGRHLLLCFSQLKLIKHIMEAMFAQGHCFGEEKWQVDKIVQ